MYFRIVIETNLYSEKYNLSGKCYFYRGEYNLEIVSFTNYKEK